MLTTPVRRARGLLLGAAEIDRLIAAGYRLAFGREPDPDGAAGFARALRRGWVGPAEFLDRLGGSAEARAGRAYPTALHALHASRCQMVRQLPKAARIVDLGGGTECDPRGALVAMGYPYPFESLTIVEPPAADRHAIYQDVAPDRPTRIDTDRGVVEYLSSSMADLSAIASGSVDLVFSGESIEHVSVADAGRVIAEARRVLRPGGWFCFDTPNRAVTRLHVGDDQFVNPDHKHEYTHPELLAMLTAGRFDVAEAKGLSWMPGTVRTGAFEVGEMLGNVGLYDDPAACYLLYYRCRPSE